MDYLLDTNMVGAWAEKNLTVRNHISRLSSSDRILTCFIVVGEWEYSIHNAKSIFWQERNRAAGRPVFEALVDIWQSSPAICRHYGEIHTQLRSTGRLIPTNDIWIAAVAREYSATVVTTDAHFGSVEGLSVVNWTLP